ncbi:MAG: hypothetical protein JWQ27_566 [Ferruginibacter sp.]|nr:hypothetical protein [Ferruginibacter sp.]
MQFPKKVCLALCMWVAVMSANAQVQTARYVSMTTMSKGYYEYLPQGYNPASLQTYPLILFIHGLGECGDGTTQLSRVLNNGTPKQINQGIFPTSFTNGGSTYKYIVISPQFVDWPGPVEIDNIINYVSQNYRVDINRIYLTGLSMGGGVVWEYCGISSYQASRVAAIVPVCGAGWPDQGYGRTIAGANVAVWATHNDGDPTVPVMYTNQYIVNINGAPTPPTPLAKKSIFVSNSHDAWSATYNLNFRENGQNVYEWMLNYKRNITVLAVTGLDFHVTKNAGKVLLSWKTQSETNNAGFDVERSADGRTFSRIAEQASISINGSGASYTFTDPAPLPGTNYYRLRQKDQNNNFSYSEIRSADFTSKGMFSVYPNPVGATLNLSSDYFFINGTLSVFDVKGVKLKQFKLQGSGMQQLPLSELPPGFYIADISDGLVREQIRFIKK